MHERDTVFRDRLIQVLSGLRGTGRKDAELRKLIGAYVMRMAREAGVRDWADLKERADGSTYDSMLKLFQTQSAAASKSGDAKAVRAFEMLALSLISRRQTQADLVPGVEQLDKFIANCAAAVRRAGIISIPITAKR